MDGIGRQDARLRLGVSACEIGWLGQDGEGDGVGCGGVVAEAEIEEDGGGVGGGEGGRGGGGAGKFDGVADEAIGYGGGGGEVRVGGDGVDEVEVGAEEGAGGCGVGGAADVGERGQADEGCEGEPVAWSAVGSEGAEAELTEGGGSEGLEWVKGSEDGVGVLEHK